LPLSGIRPTLPTMTGRNHAGLPKAHTTLPPRPRPSSRNRRQHPRRSQRPARSVFRL